MPCAVERRLPQISVWTSGPRTRPRWPSAPCSVPPSGSSCLPSGVDTSAKIHQAHEHTQMHHAYMSKHARTCAHTHTHTHTQICIQTYKRQKDRQETDTNTHIHEHQKCTCTCAHAHTHTHTHAHTKTDKHTHTHAHTHTHKSNETRLIWLTQHKSNRQKHYIKPTLKTVSL